MSIQSDYRVFLEKHCQEWEMVFTDKFWNPVIDKIERRVNKILEHDRRLTRRIEGKTEEPYPQELLFEPLSNLSLWELHWDNNPKFNFTIPKSNWIWHNFSNEECLIDWLENKKPKDNNSNTIK